MSFVTQFSLADLKLNLMKRPKSHFRQKCKFCPTFIPEFCQSLDHPHHICVRARSLKKLTGELCVFNLLNFNYDLLVKSFSRFPTLKDHKVVPEQVLKTL